MVQREFLAPPAQFRLLEVDFLHVGRGTHDAFKLMAMIQPEGMAQLVDYLLFKADKQQVIIFREAVKPGLEARGGNNSRLTAQLRFTEDKRENGNVEVDVDHRNRFLIGEGVLIQQFCQKERRIILPAGGVKGTRQVQRTSGDDRLGPELITNLLRNAEQSIVPER